MFRGPFIDAIVGTDLYHLDAAIGTTAERINTLHSRFYIPRGEEGVVGSKVCVLNSLGKSVLVLDVEELEELSKRLSNPLVFCVREVEEPHEE